MKLFFLTDFPNALKLVKRAFPVADLSRQGAEKQYVLLQIPVERAVLFLAVYRARQVFCMYDIKPRQKALETKKKCLHFLCMEELFIEF